MYAGFFQAVVGQFATHDKVVDTFKSGEGDLGETTILAVFVVRIVFLGQPMILIWLGLIPALNGIEEKLKSGVGLQT